MKSSYRKRMPKIYAINIRVDEDIMTALKQVSYYQNKPVSTLIRELIIKKYFKNK